MGERRGAGGQRDLSVRSVLLSILLGAHPEAMPPSRLVAAAAYFGMSESAARAALTRAVTTGDLTRTQDGYALGDRLLRRQHRQAEAVAAHPAPWGGAWETAIVVAAGRPVGQRSALRATLVEHRLAELREGVWLRPANLAREPAYGAHPDLTTCETRHPDPRELTDRLWDLASWDATGREILASFATVTDPPERLAVAARMVRHLATDPILPPDLLPRDWPGGELRHTYAAYQQELRDLT